MEACVRSWIVYSVKVFILMTIFGVGDSLAHVDSEIKELDKFIKRTVACRKVPGLAVAVVKDGEVILSRGYGHADIENNIKATEHTEFCVGSLTKAFTSTVIADILSSYSNFTWDTKIKDILGPKFQLSDDIRTQHANIRDLLSHKIGTPANFHALLVGFPGTMSRADLVEKLRYMPACSEFRAEFHYSNYMYMLAGYVAEVMSGESWENLVAKRLLNRLGMRSTGFIDSGRSLNTTAVPYVLKKNKLVPIEKELLLTVSPSGPAGSIYSTAADMAKWMLFHLRGGKSGHHDQVVSRRFLQETYRSEMTHPFQDKDLTEPTYPVSDATLSYNMGWMTSLYRGYRKLWHSGGIVTFVSQLWLFPDVRSGVFVTTSGPLNQHGSMAVKNIASRISDFLLGKEPWLNSTSTCTFPAPWEEPPPDMIARDEIKKHTWNISSSKSTYVGLYGNMGFGKINVYSENGDSLVLEYGRFGKMELLPITEVQFIGHYVDKLWFITNSDGSTMPISIIFVRNNLKEVTGLLFPVDFEMSKTLFTKGTMYDARRNTSHQPYTSTSLTCSADQIITLKSHIVAILFTTIYFIYVNS
ncbi:hypothetical protein ACF0H5_010775 [Mactra antiquata]